MRPEAVLRMDSRKATKVGLRLLFERFGDSWIWGAYMATLMNGFCKYKACVLMSFTLLGLPVAHVASAQSQSTLLPSDPVIVVPAAPDKGFNFPYVLYLPADVTKASHPYLLVEPNNTGDVSDDFSVHLLSAISGADGSTNSIGHFVAKRLDLPLLVPAFPRPKSEWLIYTHALNRRTMMVKKGPLARLDLQLIAMIRDAQRNLEIQGIKVQDKILINGFSASGTFANRFVFLHPSLVAGAAYGGVNGILMLPLKESDGRSMKYPLGIGDINSLTDVPFDLDTFKAIPQFIYMGADDDNDAATGHEDAYSNVERDTIYKVLGKRMMPDRWVRAQSIYHDSGINASFKTYQGIAHGTNRAINTEVSDFFQKILQTDE